MPSITGEAEVSFSVYCATCGEGLCEETSVNDRTKNVYVNACPTCIKIKDDEIARLNEKIEELESRRY